ncbi:SH3 domain-containing protein [Altererythrobacter lauratis]|uniref:SH3 domain-containing protein n=1 Tax=Alteraurantiacibacter lauratis TaxID=2054627 RepID=A0ABV7ECD4_9SPHN
MKRILLRLLLPICLATGLMQPTAASAQDRAVPYWASLSSEEVNLRVGPSERYRIAWVYRREGLPVKVLRLQQGWRLIEEVDGTRGWVFNQLLSLRRTAIVTEGAPVPMRDMPARDAALRWNVEQGVIGNLGACEADWCEFSVGRRRGWVPRDRLWGAGAP